MKKLLLAVITAFIPLVSQAQDWDKTTSGQLTTSDKVGIWTNSPSEILQIGDRWTFHNGGHKIIGYNYHFNGGDKRMVSDEVAALRFTDEGDIRLMTGGYGSAGSSIGWVNTLILKNSGNIGIGILNPTEKLHVSGRIQIEGNNSLRFNSTSASNPYNAISFMQQGASRWVMDYGTGTTQDLRFIKFNGTSGTTFLNFDYANNQLEIPAVQVGIGTSTMGTHKLAVDGSIGSREIIVEPSGWSDFVFANDYHLQPLEEVEEFIHHNQHLPEIPSESEVINNGLNLGEMDAKLLQKIEELTLYLINQNKEIKNLKREVSSLKNK